MNSLFESFSRLVDEIPDGAVLRTIQAEANMLLKDLEDRRVSTGSVEERDAKSILTFAEFVNHGWSSIDSCQFVPPLDHLAYYRRVLERLVDIGVLPYLAKESFDRTFSSAFMKELDIL